MNTAQMYRENILDHYKHPRNKGVLESCTCKHHESNPICGDEVTMQVRLNHDMIEEIRFMGHGCAISLAAASMLTEHAKAKNIENVLGMTDETILELLGIPVTPVRMKCATLALISLQKALCGGA